MGFNSHCKDKSGEYYGVAKGRVGLNPKLSLPEACADFYVLERLVADGYPPAVDKLNTFETMLAKEFSSYLDIAIGGEIRHTWHVSGSDECEECYGEGHIECSDCYGEGQTECWQCDGSGMIETEDDEGDMISEDCDHCDGDGHEECGECFGEGNQYCDYCDGEGSSHSQSSWEDLVDPRLGKFINKVRTRKGHGSKMWGDERALAWDQWVHIRHIYGLDAVSMAIQCFEEEEIWGSGGGFGGEMWASVARLLYDYLSDNIPRRVFINMAWSLEHNGGCIFDKVYNETNRLRQVLQLQSVSEHYDKITNYDAGYQNHNMKESLLDCASSEVQKAWANFDYLKTTAAGRRWLGEHKLVMATQRLKEASSGWDALGWQRQVDALRMQYWTSE